jgi:hypothetical protein
VREGLETAGEIGGAVLGGLSFGGGVLGKGVGKLLGAATRPASAVRVVARVRGGLDTIRARQGAAVAAFEKLVDLGSQGVREAARGGAAVAKRVPPAVARQAQQDRRAAMVSTIERVGQLAGDPNRLAKETSGAVSVLHEAAPDVANAMVGNAARAIAYLSSVAPPIYRPQYSSGIAMIDPTAAAAYGRKLLTVKDPDAAIALLGRGALTQDHIEALKACYPKRWESLKREILDTVGSRAAEGRPVSFAARTQMSIDPDLVLDESLRPADFAMIQGSMAPLPSPEGSQPGPSPIKPPELSKWQQLEAG